MSTHGAQTVEGNINPAGTWTCLDRVTALEGTGTQQVGDVGKPVKQADVSTITCNVYDLGKGGTSDPTEITPAPTVTKTSAIYDTLQTTGWDADALGYNFRYDLTPTYCPTAFHVYLARFTVTLTGGGVFHLFFRAKAGGSTWR